MTAETLISIVDDDEFARKGITRLMKSLGFRVEAFASAMAFLAFPKIADTACLIADVQMPHMTGFELHRRLVTSGHAIPTILITGYPDEDLRGRAMADGIICYLTKPFYENALIACVQAALEQSQLREDHS